MREPVHILRRALPVLSVALVLAVLYDGWIFYSRWRSAREGERASREAEIQHAKDTIDLIGGTGFHIMNFYASPQVIARGAKSRICYGVYGAKSLRTEPPVADIRPAASNCVEVSPHNDTTYQLIAEDGAGHTATASLAIKVTQ